MAFGATGLWRSWQTRTWRVVLGYIAALDYPEVRRSKGQPVHRFELRYAYTVDGRCFESSRLTSSAALRALGWLPPAGIGEPVTVYYDPADPRRAVLRNGFEAIDLGGVVVGVLLAAWGMGSTH